MFFCFSSGKNGTAISFLMEYDSLSFVEAVEELAKRAGVEVPREGGNEPRVVMDGPLDALAAAQRYFIERLRHAPSAIEYLKKRGVSDDIAKRSEEHTSELQSLMRISSAVFCLKKKNPPEDSYHY